MKIAIEAQRIFRNKKHGMDIVALELIRHLQQIDHENEYFILVRRDLDRQVLSETKNFHIIELPSVAYPIWEQYYLPKAVKKIAPDILHCTSSTAPIRLSKKIPLVLTLHDVLFMKKGRSLKGTLYQRLGNLYRRWVVPKVLPHCSQIITVSQFEKKEISRFFKLNPAKINMVYNAFNQKFGQTANANDRSNIQEKYHLPDRYFLFLGNTDPKKNITNVLKGYQGYCRQQADPIPLVIPDIHKSYLGKILRRIHAPGLASLIYLTGYVRNEDLPHIYLGASAFLYPSLYESFGIPLLEAMACGIPVISSQRGAIPEVAGDAAILVNPEQPEEIAAAMNGVFNDQQKIEELKENGRKRVTEFSWYQTAQGTLDIYKKVSLSVDPPLKKLILE